jgi:hypothetical protein
VHHGLSTLSGVRVVRDHQDGFVELVAESLEEREHLLAGLRIEVTGWLVTEDDGWIAYDGPRYANALLLAPGELSRKML